MEYFAGIERFSEHVYVNVYGKANSANAAKFLRELIENTSYQVPIEEADPNEEQHQELAMPLFVLPLAKSTYRQDVTKILARIPSQAPDENSTKL